MYASAARKAGRRRETGLGVRRGDIAIGDVSSELFPLRRGVATVRQLRAASMLDFRHPFTLERAYFGRVPERTFSLCSASASEPEPDFRMAPRLRHPSRRDQMDREFKRASRSHVTSPTSLAATFWLFGGDLSRSVSGDRLMEFAFVLTFWRR